MKVLFVCTANICRSAYAVRRAEALAEEGSALEFASGGTLGTPGLPMSAEIAAELEQRGGSADGFESARLGPEARSADIVLTMENSHKAFVIDEYPELIPRTFTIRQFAAALEQLDPQVRGKAVVRSAYRFRRSSPGDVDDPYLRGAEAAHRCADEIDALLAAILPRLEPEAVG